MSRSLLLAISCVACLVPAAWGGEKVARIRRLPIVPAKKVDPKKRPKFPVKVAAPFESLARTKYSKKMAALSALVERGHELSSAAAAEARRLNALPQHKNERVQEVLDSVIVSLETLCAERSLMTKWKKGLGPGAEKVSGREVDLTCRNLSIKKLLGRVSKGWGVKIELSPVAAKLKQTLDVDLDGAPNLKQFLGWLSTSQSLSCGHIGDRLVLVPSCSVKLKKALEKQRQESAKAKRGK